MVGHGWPCNKIEIQLTFFSVFSSIHCHHAGSHPPDFLDLCGRSSLAIDQTICNLFWLSILCLLRSPGLLVTYPPWRVGKVY